MLNNNNSQWPKNFSGSSNSLLEFPKEFLNDQRRLETKQIVLQRREHFAVLYLRHKQYYAFISECNLYFEHKSFPRQAASYLFEYCFRNIYV